MELGKTHDAVELFQAQCHIYKHMYQFIESMALKCAVQLGIPDIIHKHDQPITLQELVSELRVPPQKADCLRRLMDMLVHTGFFATARIHENDEEDEEGYVLAPPSTLLLKDSPTNLSPTVLGLVHPALIPPWFSLGDWFRGEDLTAFETYHGMSFGDYAKENQEFVSSLNEALACDARFASLVIRDHDEIFKGVRSLVDLGGGKGALARAIADTYPEIRCTVLDLPQVVANLPETENLKFVGGDMFQSIPSADAIIIKSVMLNWSDEDCVKILERCKEAIPSKNEGGKVIIVEMVIDDREDEPEVNKTRLFVDMEMMLTRRGRGRNKNEWEKLFMEAGFTGYNIKATSGLDYIIEVFP